jgi:hypothetical protein
MPTLTAPSPILQDVLALQAAGYLPTATQSAALAASTSAGASAFTYDAYTKPRVTSFFKDGQGTYTCTWTTGTTTYTGTLRDPSGVIVLVSSYYIANDLLAAYSFP